jgi:Rod binding domain-containing protein
MSQLSSIPTWTLPSDIRAAGTEAIKDYKTAVGFEQMLAGQLVKSMVSEDSSLGEGPYASTMQETLTSALTSGQGLGLARQIYKEMQS